MNFWATIEHSLNYKFKESLPEDVRDRLKKAAEAASQLDTEMTSIRKEILDAQTEFEEQSNVVSKVLNGIQDLYFYHRVREAAQFQMKFNEKFEKEDYHELNQLSLDIQAAIGKAKKANQT